VTDIALAAAVSLPAKAIRLAARIALKASALMAEDEQS
jgi:hypothetical protein